MLKFGTNIVGEGSISNEESCRAEITSVKAENVSS